MNIVCLMFVCFSDPQNPDSSLVCRPGPCRISENPEESSRQPCKLGCQEATSWLCKRTDLHWMAISIPAFQFSCHIFSKFTRNLFFCTDHGTIVARAATRHFERHHKAWFNAYTSTATASRNTCLPSDSERIVDACERCLFCQTRFLQVKSRRSRSHALIDS